MNDKTADPPENPTIEILHGLVSERAEDDEELAPADMLGIAAGVSARAYDIVSDKLVNESDPKKRRELAHALRHLATAAENLMTADIALEVARDNLAIVADVLPGLVITKPEHGCGHDHGRDRHDHGHGHHDHDHGRVRGRQLRRPRKPRAK